MSHKMKNRPAIFIDMKKSRIRIHKCTLELLGNPSYIQLLVNPSAQTIAIKRTTGSDYLSHKIHDKCCELYSRNFLRALCSASSGWNEQEAYRIYGTLIESCQLIQFSMEDSIRVNNLHKGVPTNVQDNDS